VYSILVTSIIEETTDVTMNMWSYY